MNMNEAWIGIDESQVMGYMKSKKEGKILGYNNMQSSRASTYRFYQPYSL